MAFLKNISNSEIPDKELLILYKESGDLSTLGILYQRYMDLVYGVCVKYLQDEEAAKDAVMQIFEELIKKLQHHEVSYFKSWLHTLSKNYCLMQLRSANKGKIVAIEDSLMQSEDETHLNGMLYREEQLVKLEYCLHSLDPEQKRSVELFYLEHKCYNEIVVITGYEWSRVKSLIQNGRRNLKICMEKGEE